MALYTDEIYVQNQGVTIDFMQALTTDYYPQSDCQIMTVTDLVNAPTTTILLNDVAYVLEDPILAGDKVTISVDIASVIILNLFCDA